MATGDEVYTNFFEVGKFFCSGCGNYLYRSGDKFQSPGKWPAFAKAATEESVLLEEDFSVGILRTVIVCKQCSKEIGHVYNDAQQLAGVEGQQRHTVSSKNLRFEANPEGGEPQLISEAKPAAPAATIEVVEKKETSVDDKEKAAAAAAAGKRTAAQARQLLKEMSDSDSDSDSDSSSEEEKPAAKKTGNAAKAPVQPAAAPSKKPVAAATQKPVAKKEEKSGGSYLTVLALGAAAIAAGFVGYRYYVKRDAGK
eukprot:TRINITY_DN3474_c0_g1_i1.p1 TRINITY_DN3474_c0_g1~~TRINITY_DN3474_c0_g1_i1.p1  ORF type:complete len:267 (+),score=90.08 TRINITY_DN3474_c0_g1_i1:42-803(+)